MKLMELFPEEVNFALLIIVEMMILCQVKSHTNFKNSKYTGNNVFLSIPLFYFSSFLFMHWCALPKCLLWDADLAYPFYMPFIVIALG